MNRFFDGVLDDVRAAPGVVAVGAVTILPTRGNNSAGLRVVGEPVGEAHLPDIRYVAVRGDYFRAMRIPLLAGRVYDASDGAEGPKTVVINQAAERQFFPRGDALGRRIRIGPDPAGERMTVVGVVGDVRGDGPAASSKPMMFADHRRETWQRTLSIVARPSGDPAGAASVLRRAVRRADPTLAIRDVQPLDDVVGSSLSARRFALGLVSSCAAIALVLAAIGVYGVLAYAVANRTRELGVRLALGATPRSVSLLVLRQRIASSLIGLGAGVAAARAGGRLVEGTLFGVRATDPATFAAVAAGLLAVVVVACVVPAWRATRVDPITSVGAE